MSALSPIGNALDGIRRNLGRFDETAARLARTAPGDDLPRDFVELRIAKYGVQVAVAVVRAADELTGSLLDTLA